MSARACKCWNDFRRRKCKDTPLILIGDDETYREGDSYKYFMRTDSQGQSMGDTSNYWGHPDDFVYIHDTTCSKRNVPRM